MRLLILETIGGDTAGKCAAWTLPAMMLAWSRSGKVMENTVCLCTEVLSTTMIEGSTPVRQLIVEIVASETIGKHADWPLLTAICVQRRQSVVRGNTVDHYAEVLSTTKIEGAHR